MPFYDSTFSRSLQLSNRNDILQQDRKDLSDDPGKKDG